MNEYVLRGFIKKAQDSDIMTYIQSMMDARAHSIEQRKKAAQAFLHYALQPEITPDEQVLSNLFGVDNEDSGRSK